MHSILGRESFCRNDCFNAAWHGGNQPVALLRCYGGPGCFDSGLKLIQSVGSCVSQLSLHNIPQILYGVQVRRVGRPIEHSNTLVSKPFTSGFGTVSRCQVVLKNEIFISIKLFSRWKHEVLQDESKFCMSFGNQGARVWRKTGEKEMPKCLKSSVKYPQSVMVWGAMSAAGVGPLCFIKGRVNAASYQEILEHFMLPSAEKLYGDEDFVFQHDLAPAHSAKTTGKWFTDHGITVLNWPANSPDLNPIENLWDIVKRKLRDARPNTLDELKAAIEASWASITPQQCHRLIASMPRRIEAVISAKGFPTKY
uniref:Tc1-like transposase DDE domain-containing protein n=1 Tax=Cyprinus carpio carpio TaxID=630221 RepID=A0A9J8C6G5_CYPCA